MFRVSPERPLFTGTAPLEAEMRIRKRPLGEVSDFVVERLPEAAYAVSVEKMPVETLADTVDQLVRGISEDEFQAFIHSPRAGFGGYNPDIDLASLDLKMLEAVIVNNDGEAPQSLTQRVDEISAVVDQPPVLTYEEVIIGDGYGNSQSDPRVFTGEANYHFLHGHSIIDSKIRQVISQVRRAKETLRENGRDGVGEAVQRLEQGSTIFFGTILDMEAYRSRLSPEDFIGFRKYYGEHKMRGFKGPSGAFTDTIPVLDLTLSGELIPEEQRQYLKDNIQYFPREGRRLIVNAGQEADEGGSLTGLFVSLGRPQELIEPMLSINRGLGAFRGRHGAVVEVQLEDVLKSKTATGTAGEHIRSFLGSRRESTRSIGQEIRRDTV